MKTSTDRILTTHVGSLARPTELLDTMKEKENGRAYDPPCSTSRSPTQSPTVCGVRSRAASTSSPTAR